MEVRKVLIGVVAVVLAGLACLSVSPRFGGDVRWTPDALFYQARVFEIRGTSNDVAIRRVFEGPISKRLRDADRAKTGNPAWVKFNEPFYERRVSVPLAAAALYPIAHSHSLLYVSLAGYIAAVLALFGLLLLRFRLVIATVVAAATVFLPPLVKHSSYPLTDSWGLALEILAFAAALLTLDRGRRWLVLWIGVILVLSFTRDSTWIPVLAAGWCAARYRSRIAATLLVTGVAAALPALLIFSTPTRPLLAELVNHSAVPSDTSWTFIARHYPHAAFEVVRANVGFLRRGEWYTAFYLVGGVIALFGLARRMRPGDLTPSLLRAGVVVGAGYVLAAPLFSAFRLELVFVPMAAYGLALATELAAARVGALDWLSMHAPGRRRRSAPPEPNRMSS
jgi:hypothetical protein